jgi:hypothetical protein
MSTSSTIASPRGPVWPVWKGSTQTAKVWRPINRKAAIRLFHRARDLDRRTHQSGRHGGIVGHAALQVLHTLVFDFLNFRTGRLDPGYDAIAEKANLARSTIAVALKRLAGLGILTWERRCSPSTDDAGRFRLQQETNAYTLHPEHAWQQVAVPASSPSPAPSPTTDELGFPTTHQSRADLTAAWQLVRDQDSPKLLEDRAALLELERGDMLAQSKARFLRRLADERRRKEQKPDALTAAVHRLSVLFSRRPQ